MEHSPRRRLSYRVGSSLSRLGRSLEHGPAERDGDSADGRPGVSDR